jgi:Asp/Glu/hydantoin racemase
MFDAAIIAALGAPGLLGACELFDFPIVAVGEAAMLTASMLGRRVAIVAFTPALSPWCRERVDMHGLSARCAGICTLDSAFASIAPVRDEKEGLLVDLARRAVVEDGAMAAVKQAEALVTRHRARQRPAPSTVPMPSRWPARRTRSPAG